MASKKIVILRRLASEASKSLPPRKAGDAWRRSGPCDDACPASAAKPITARPVLAIRDGFRREPGQEFGWGAWQPLFRHSRESGNPGISVACSLFEARGRLWAPAFPTGQARGPKAHGTTNDRLWTFLPSRRAQPILRADPNSNDKIAIMTFHSEVRSGVRGAAPGSSRRSGVLVEIPQPDAAAAGERCT